MRRRAASRGFPLELARFGWRDWRPPPEPDDPAPWYSTWYLGLGDWHAARRAYAEEHGVPVQMLPREKGVPPEPELFAASQPKPGQATNTPPVRETSGEAASPRVNRAKSMPRARPIKLR
ncbi:hypothetical protein [Streptomyces althioticus]|uniref:hypothetical protein n=1 Tax=Streptomyces althioticus TaxID=83380 RepID=UPI00332299F4